jgi:hypothetical protein
LRWHAAHFLGGSLADYDDAVVFLQTPAALDERWIAYGWRWLREPERPDWHDGAGYFTRVPRVTRPVQALAFDPEYAQHQLDRCMRLWLLTGQSAFLRFANALLNVTLPLVDRSTWLADFRGGSRRSGIWPYFNAGVALLHLHDHRFDIPAADVRDQVALAVDAEYRARACAGPLDGSRISGYGYTLLSLLIGTTPALMRVVKDARTGRQTSGVPMSGVTSALDFGAG